MKISGLSYLKSVVGRLSFRSQSAFWYFVFPLSLYLLFVCVCGYYYLTSLNQPGEERIQMSSAFVGEKVDRFLAERMNEIINLSVSPVAKNICEGTLTKSSWHDYTRNSLKTSVSFDELMLCDTLGNTLATNKADHEGNRFPVEYDQQNHFGEEWFRACLVSGGPVGGAYISDINLAEYNFKHTDWGIDFATPVKSDSGKLIGVLKTRLNWNATVQSIISGNNLTSIKKDVLFIFNHQGNLIAGGGKAVLRLGKNKMNRKPDFALNGSYFSSEDFHFHWEESKGSGAFRGNGWYILTMTPLFGISYLISDTTFIYSLLVPGFVLIIILIVGWIRWRGSFLKQLESIAQQMKRLNEGKKISPSFSGALEMKNIQGELNRLQNYFTSTEQVFQHAIQYEKVSFEKRSGEDHFSETVSEFAGLYLLMHRDAVQNHYISKGIQDVTAILYSNEKELALKKFCSYIQKYLNVIAMACFFPKEDKLFREASWGLHADDHTIEDYNLLFDCMKSKKMIQLYDASGKYLNLQSGLGNSRQNHIYLIPMIFAQRCDGVLEVASLKPLPEDAIRFLEQCGSMLAVFWQYQLQEREAKVKMPGEFVIPFINM